MQAILPVLREMGMPQGHVRQSSLEARLALIAAAPWKAAAPKPSQALVPTSASAGAAASASGDRSSAAAEAQAIALLQLAWAFVFEAPAGSMHFLDIR